MTNGRIRQAAFCHVLCYVPFESSLMNHRHIAHALYLQQSDRESVDSLPADSTLSTFLKVKVQFQLFAEVFARYIISRGFLCWKRKSKLSYDIEVQKGYNLNLISYIL